MWMGLKKYLFWGHKEVDDIVIEFLKLFFDVFLEEINHFSSYNGVLVMNHIGEVYAVIVLG